MPVKEVLDIRPTGWETDPPEERCKLSPIDATPNAAYNHYMLFFRMQDSRKKDALSVMKRGLEVSLRYATSQDIRQLYLAQVLEKLF